MSQSMDARFGWERGANAKSVHILKFSNMLRYLANRKFITFLILFGFFLHLLIQF